MARQHPYLPERDVAKLLDSDLGWVSLFRNNNSDQSCNQTKRGSRTQRFGVFAYRTSERRAFILLSAPTHTRNHRSGAGAVVKFDLLLGRNFGTRYPVTHWRILCPHWAGAVRLRLAGEQGDLPAIVRYQRKPAVGHCAARLRIDYGFFGTQNCQAII